MSEQLSFSDESSEGQGMEVSEEWAREWARRWEEVRPEASAELPQRLYPFQVILANTFNAIGDMC